ncbi:ATP-binding protein [Kitasatospora sp. NPDC094028]
MPTSVSSEFSQLALADTPNAVPWARRHVVDVLRRWRVPADHIDTAELLVSELTSNAVRHSGQGQDRSPYSQQAEVQSITVTLQRGPSRLLLLVHDYDRRPPVLKMVGDDAESGRGIFLVAAMSTRWGHYFPRLADGKVVWAELLLTAPAAEQLNPPKPDQAPPLLVARTLVGLRGL